MNAHRTFPNLASLDVLVIRNGEACYVRRADLMPELAKRGWLAKFGDLYVTRSRKHTPQGDYFAWDAEQTIEDLMAKDGMN